MIRRLVCIPDLVVCSVIRFDKCFLKSILEIMYLMDSVGCLKRLNLDYELRCRFVLFGSFPGVPEFLGMLLLFGFGLRMCSDRFCSGLIGCLCYWLGKLRIRFWSKSGVGGGNEVLIDKMEEWEGKSNSYIDSDEIVNSDSVEEYDSDNNEVGDEKLNFHLGEEFDAADDIMNGEKQHIDETFGENLGNEGLIGAYDTENSVRNITDEDCESDVFTLRRMLKIERHRGNAACMELEKERAAAATAAKEAMAMILRLQHEKSWMEMESIQYRRLTEEKQAHDQEVIQSLQWLVWRHKMEKVLLEDQLRVCRHHSEQFSKRGDRNESEEVGECLSCFSGNLWDAFENVFYSSLDAADLSDP